MVIGYKDPSTGQRMTTRQDRCQLQFGQRSSSGGKITQQISWVAEEGAVI